MSSHVVYICEQLLSSYTNVSRSFDVLCNRAGACDITSAALNQNVWQKRVAFVWKHAMNRSCSTISCTNRDMKETKNKRYKVFSNTGENRREDSG